MIKRKYLQVFADRFGRERIYFRRRGYPRIAMPMPNTARFEEVYADLCRRSDAAAEHAPRVYFLKSGEHIKIGTTTHLGRRMANLRTYSPYPVVLVGWIPGDRLVERETHKKFAYAKVAREWFEATTELLLFIRTENRKRRRTSNFSSTSSNSRTDYELTDA